MTWFDRFTEWLLHKQIALALVVGSVMGLLAAVGRERRRIRGNPRIAWFIDLLFVAPMLGLGSYVLAARWSLSIGETTLLTAVLTASGFRIYDGVIDRGERMARGEKVEPIPEVDPVHRPTVTDGEHQRHDPRKPETAPIAALRDKLPLQASDMTMKVLLGRIDRLTQDQDGKGKKGQGE